jgi:hypothetical protein
LNKLSLFSVLVSFPVLALYPALADIILLAAILPLIAGKSNFYSRFFSFGLPEILLGPAYPADGIFHPEKLTAYTG